MRSAVAMVAVVVALAGCGGGEDESGEPDPREAVEAVQAEATPDGPWDVPGTRWARLSEAEREDLAEQFMAAHPDRCEGADPEQVAGYVTAVYGIDYPEHLLAGVILPEACDASLQS